MDQITAVDLLERARAHAARGDLSAAFDAFMAADSVEPLGLLDLPVLADAAYATGHLDTTIEAWERLHTASLEAGDRMTAANAAVHVALHLLIDTGLLASVRGWALRTERLLVDADEGPVHAWLAVVHMYERLLSGDAEDARSWTRRAIEIGTEHGQPAAVALGRVAEARCVIFDGDLEGGLALLDEAAIAALSGELDPISAGVLWCELICACQGLGQRERAEEWTTLMERWRDSSGVGSFGGRCRVHRAELLRMRGTLAEAEEEALRACEELRPYLRLEFGWPLTELGRIRLLGGDLGGAEEALLAAHHIGWEPQPELALLWLAQGDADGAAAAIRDAVESPLNVPSKELPPKTELRLAPLLVAQVEIALSVGDLETARTASKALDRIAGLYASKALGAGAALARGRVLLAEGQTASAKKDLKDALRFWSEIGAPYEAAQAREALAAAYRSEGNEDRAILELQAARAAFKHVDVGDEALGHARTEPSGTSTTIAQRSAGQTSAPPANVLRNEGDYWSITFEGRTQRIRDLVGLRYIAMMLADPGREFFVLDLVASGDRGPSGDAGALLDASAKEAYKRRLTEIEEDLADADSEGDTERSARVNEERDFLIRELARAVGLSGRDRRAGDASERARASVTRAIRHAMARASVNDPDLGEHFERTIRTGTYCTYLPDPRAPGWQL